MELWTLVLTSGVWLVWRFTKSITLLLAICWVIDKIKDEIDELDDFDN